jgi:hypothetical protein
LSTYELLLTIHSLIRWILLALLGYGIYISWRGWITKKTYTRYTDRIRVVTLITTHLQLTIGLALYAVSPIVRYFLGNFSEAVHLRDMRFFGMEHITMMVIAMAFITIGSLKAKKKHSHTDKFRTLAWWYSIALLIIFISIPWAFSPFTARPYFRF